MATLGTYMAALLIYNMFDLVRGRSMGNEGLAFWQSTGTVIAAVIGSIWGSNYAFEMNRRRDLDLQRKKDLESGRWALVSIGSQITYLIRILDVIYKSIHEYGEEDPRLWKLFMQSFHDYEEPQKLNLLELRFLLDRGKVGINYLLIAANESSVLDVKGMIAIRNGLKEKAKEKLNKHIELRPFEWGKSAVKREDSSKFYDRVVNVISEPLTTETSLLAEQLLYNCESGIRRMTKLYDELILLLRDEFPNVDFKDLDKKGMEKQLGKNLWD